MLRKKSTQQLLISCPATSPRTKYLISFIIHPRISSFHQLQHQHSPTNLQVVTALHLSFLIDIFFYSLYFLALTIFEPPSSNMFLLALICPSVLSLLYQYLQYRFWDFINLALQTSYLLIENLYCSKTTRCAT